MEGMVSTERGEGLLATGLAELLLSKRRADLKEQRPNLATIRPDMRTVRADLSQRGF
jgi:hypothetical protein